jgi:hypothetical protein
MGKTECGWSYFQEKRQGRRGLVMRDHHGVLRAHHGRPKGLHISYLI